MVSFSVGVLRKIVVPDMYKALSVHKIRQNTKMTTFYKTPYLEYQKSLYPYINTAMGLALEDRDGFVKFLADKMKGRILGCHIIGSEASILIHEVLVAMRADDNGGTIDNIRKTVHIHPALSEVVSRAAANIHGI
jgi:mycothione reductase